MTESTDHRLRSRDELHNISMTTILALALPALGVLAATPLYLLLDTAVVGHLGKEDLAALGAATTIQATVTTQLTFLSYGTTARASRLFGAGRKKDAVAEGVQSTFVALGVGVVLAGIILLFAPTFTRWLTGDATVAHESTVWLRIAGMGIPAMLVTMAGNGWLRGIQNTRLPLYFTLAGVIPSAVLVPILVTRMGIAGSAWANLIGESITALLFFLCLVTCHNGDWRPNLPVMTKQLAMGRDLIVRSLSFQVSFISAAAVAARFGSASLAAHQVMLQLWNFLSLVLDSLAIAAQALTGAALGAQSVQLAKRVGVKVTAYSAAFAGILVIVFAAGFHHIPRLFTPDEQVLSMMNNPWWIMVILLACAGVVFALDGVLLGAGDVAYLRNATIAAVLLGFLPGVWIALAVDGGLTGVWLGLLAFMVLRLLLVCWRFADGKWAKTGADA